MISPDFRATEVPNLIEAFKFYIVQNHGDGLYKDLEPEFTRCAYVRKEIVDALYHRTDPDQLRKFKDLFLENYKVQSLFQKYFTYGNNKNQVNLTYTWYDSFTKQKKQSMSPTFDAISSLYNYGVACSRIACYMDLSGDGIKEASKLFQQAGWVFEHMRTLVTQLSPSEISSDFTAEALGMLSNLMLAQAQYLFYKKASDAGMKSAVLSKTAMQVSEYFKKAYELSQTNQGLKAFDNSRFANIIQYHSYYFEAMAYWVIAQEEFKKAGEAGKGMGDAVGYCKLAAEKFDKAKAAVFSIPSNYQENFNSRYSEVTKLRDKAINENKTIYFERELPTNQIPKPDLQNFVKLEQLVEDLNAKLPIEDKLRHIVPPPVRGMQEELKNLLQEILNKYYEAEGRQEQEQRQLLQSYGLPQSLHAITATNELPPHVWQKIEDFQKKGAVSNLQGMITGLEGLKNNNINMITQMQKALEEEEQSDMQLRQQYGAKWNRLPSNGLNQQFKQSLSDYLNKVNQAGQTDQIIDQKFKANIDYFQLLSKTKMELSQMIPQMQGQQELSNNPVIQTLKQCLEELDKLQEEKRKVSEEAVQKIQNFNAIEDLIQVHQGTKQKGDVFEKHKKEFSEILQKSANIDQRRAGINQNIRDNIGQYSQILASIHNDPRKAEFFQKIDSAINAYNEITNMLHQGSQFYTRLGDILNKLYQNIMDFKMSREMEKNDLVSRVGGFHPQQQQQLPPGQLPQYGGQFPPAYQQFQQPGMGSMPGQPGQPGQYYMPQYGQPGQHHPNPYQFYDPNRK